MENRETASKRETGRVPRRDGQKCREIFRAVGRIGTTRNDIERDDAGARIIDGWEYWSRPQQLAVGKKLIACNRAVKWWDEQVKEAMRVRRKAHARYTSSKTSTG
ncbi:hypothetical protein [Ekhidna sp.]